MKNIRTLSLLTASCIVLAGSAAAAVTTTPLGITATFQIVPVVFSVAPLSSSLEPSGTATVGATGGNFNFYENGSLYLGFGTTVPLGTTLQNPTTFGAGAVGFFSPLSPSGQYYLPFTQELEDDGPFLKAFGYVAFDYDNATQTITLLSTTVQDNASGSLTVVEAVPEPSGAILLGAAAVAFGLRRSRKRA